MTPEVSRGLETIKEGAIKAHETPHNGTKTHLDGISNITIVFDKRKKIKEIEHDLVNQLKNEGYSNRLIAIRLGVSRNTVTKLLRPIENGEKTTLDEINIESFKSNAERIPLGNGREIVCASEKSREVIELVKDYADGDKPVLIRGETGTGKELIAMALHEFSARKGKPYIKFNSAQIDPNLADSLLFGHEKGAFTGAIKSYKGLFRQVEDGTIFLDEITHLPIPVQAKLLTFLDTGEIISVGSNHVQSPDFFKGRVVTATNKPLDDLGMDVDLVERLSVGFIELDPLRKRREDILPLADYFLENMSKNEKQHALDMSAKRLLLSYDWLRNARELMNVLDRASARPRRLSKSNGNAQIIINAEQIERSIIAFR